MSKIHSILAATDLSTPARHAAERAAQISQQHGAALCLLHVANLAPLQRLRQMLTSSHESVEQKVLATARERLQTEANALHARYGVNVDDRLVVGSLITEIRSIADELAARGVPSVRRGRDSVWHSEEAAELVERIEPRIGKARPQRNDGGVTHAVEDLEDEVADLERRRPAHWMGHVRLSQSAPKPGTYEVARLRPRLDQASALEQVISLGDRDRADAMRLAGLADGKQLLAGAQDALSDQLRGPVGITMVEAHTRILAAKHWNTFGMDHSSGTLCITVEDSSSIN